MKMHMLDCLQHCARMWHAKGHRGATWRSRKAYRYASWTYTTFHGPKPSCSGAGAVCASGRERGGLLDALFPGDQPRRDQVESTVGLLKVASGTFHGPWPGGDGGLDEDGASTSPPRPSCRPLACLALPSGRRLGIVVSWRWEQLRGCEQLLWSHCSSVRPEQLCAMDAAPTLQQHSSSDHGRYRQAACAVILV